MDIVQIIETLGIPVAVACVLGYTCLYLIKFITGKLMERLDEHAKRHENILVSLINVQKDFTNKLIETQTEMNSKYGSLIEIVQALSGNGLNKHDR
jgi:mannose/fructose/N-acetylgalactosamine-specific phosphotransferase system component IIC